MKMKDGLVQFRPTEKHLMPTCRDSELSSTSRHVSRTSTDLSLSNTFCKLNLSNRLTVREPTVFESTKINEHE